MNRSLIPRPPARHDVRILAIPTSEIARQQGSMRIANVVMLGAFLALSQPVAKASIVAAIEDVLGPGKQHLLAINLNALEAGIAFASQVPA